MQNNSSFDAEAYATMGQSSSIFGLSLVEQIETNPNIKVVCADMALAAGLDRFRLLYPDNFYNVGIAEQNLIGVAAGLSSLGYKCVAVAQAAFISMRCFEQVRQYLGYMHSNVILVGINAGFLLQHFGNTHYANEDLSLMRGIPGMTVLCPADASEAVKAFEAALKMDTPVYIRLTCGKGASIVYQEDFDYVIGKSNVIREGSDVAIFSTGVMVHCAQEAAEILEKEHISVKVIDCHTIKPMDQSVITDSKQCKLFVSLEEHNLIGGLGSSIAECVSEEKDFPPLLKLGIRDRFSKPGERSFLLEQHGLTPTQVAEKILNKYKLAE